MRKKTKFLAFAMSVCMVFGSFSIVHAAPKDTIVDFESYTADVETVDSNGNVTAITSGMADHVRTNNIVLAVKAWGKTNNLFGVKDLGDGVHENVMVLRNNPAGTRQGKPVYCGLFDLSGANDLYDLSETSLRMSFDMMIPDTSKVYNMFMEPFAYLEGVANETVVNMGDTITSDYSHTAVNSAFAQVFAPTSTTGSVFAIRKDGKVLSAAGGASTNNAFARQAYTNGAWVNVRYDISKTETGYQVDWYLDNTLIYSLTEFNQADRNDIVRGLRISMRTDTDVDYFTDLAYIDNFKIMSIENETEEPEATLTSSTDNIGVAEGTYDYADTYATGFVTTISYIAEEDAEDATFSTIKWNVTSGDETRSTTAFDFSATLAPGAEAIVGLIVDGLNDSAATAEAIIE